MPADRNAIASLPWQIRPFHPADAASISVILHHATEAAQWPPASYAALATSPGGLFLVAVANTEVIGFIAARQIADEAEILNIAVHPDFRRRSIASALLVYALDKFRTCAVSRAFLELRESNLAARALYEHHGFLASGTRKSYYRDPVEHALCMQKKLTDTSA